MTSCNSTAVDMSTVPLVHFVQVKSLSEELNLGSATKSLGRGNGPGSDVPAWQAGEPTEL